MNITIKFDNNHIFVDENEFRYVVIKDGKYYVFYKGSCVYIPLVDNVISDEIDDINEIILKYHDDIKRYLLKFSEIHDNLPNLVLCSLPIRENSGCVYRYLLDNDDRIDYMYNVGFKPANKDYRITIDYEENENCIGFHRNIEDNRYDIVGKVVFTDQPFDAEMFGAAIRTYVDTYLIHLDDLFKHNIKSARIN